MLFHETLDTLFNSTALYGNIN